MTRCPPQAASLGDPPASPAVTGAAASTPYVAASFSSSGNVATKDVAALFVQSDGCYFSLNAVDAWPKQRDARKYAGPHPVVAHPPCQLWGSLAAVNYKRWGGEHNKPGNDDGCFKFALKAVCRWGGVLEHPAGTRAWAAHAIPRPSGIGWQRVVGGWVCEVWQSAYGHRANKATWLFYSGAELPFNLDWSRPIGTHQVGQPDQRGKDKNKPSLSKREANATPVKFRDALLSLARNCGGPEKQHVPHSAGIPERSIAWPEPCEAARGGIPRHMAAELDRLGVIVRKCTDQNPIKNGPIMDLKPGDEVPF